MTKNFLKKAVIIALLTLIPTFLIWLPFFSRVKTFWSIPLPQNGMATIVSNYDGPLYIIAAKTLYNAQLIKENYQFPLPAEYYAAHLPLFPLLIRSVSLVSNYPYAMLIVTLLSSMLALYFFNKLANQYVSEGNALFLTFIFAIFPARWLIVRSVGSADPLFVAGIIASVFYFKNKNYWLAALWGVVAQLTKSPGILLFISYALFFLVPMIIKMKKLDFKKIYPLFLIPLAGLSVFIFYKVVTGNFWAYFNSGDNIHLIFPPFQIFNFSAPWVGTFWLEEIIFIYLIGAIGIYKLFQKKEFELATFSTVFYTLTLFISHRDLLRYFLPLVPFLIIAFSDSLIKKEFKIGFMVIIIPIYLYSLAFISQNVMPISNWAPFF